MSAEVQSVEVDFGDGQVTVYFKKRNLDQMDKVIKAEADGQVEVLVTTLLSRAMTEHGSMMFSDSDRKKIRKEFDPSAVILAVKAIREFDMQVEAPSGN